jgi:sugar lactone lactonase YvrE
LPDQLCLSPDQTLLYGNNGDGTISASQISSDGSIHSTQEFYSLEACHPSHTFFRRDGNMCVDTEGRLYIATSLGIQVCDQAGRVNFIILTPEQPHDVCFGGKELGDLFIACGDKVYKRSMKVHGIVSGQMPPVKPKPPHL